MSEDYEITKYNAFIHEINQLLNSQNYKEIEICINEACTLPGFEVYRAFLFEKCETIKHELSNWKLLIETIGER